MGKRKAKRARELATATPQLAERHTFSAGILGHDLTASQWLVNVSELTALGLDVVQDCVQTIADAIAGADVGQWNGTERIDPPSGFTLRPDVDLTRREFLWLFAANLALYRAVWVEEARVGGQVVGVRLHCIASVVSVGSDHYVGGKLIANPMKLVRRSVWPTLDPLTGSTIQLAREVFAGAMSANAYQSDFWQQGGAPLVVLSTDQELNGSQPQDIQDAWVTSRTTSPGKPAVIGKGAKPINFGADIGTDGANVSADKLRSSVARYFGMPPGIVNVASEAGPLTYNTVEQEGIRVVRKTFQPYADTIGEALSAYLPGDYLLGDRIVINVDQWMLPDMLTRFSAWASAISAGWISKEEVRTKEGLGPGAPDPVAAPVEAVNVPI